MSKNYLDEILEYANLPKNDECAWCGKQIKTVRMLAVGGEVEAPSSAIPPDAVPATRSPMAPRDWVRDWYANRKFGDDRDYLLNAYKNQFLPAIDNAEVSLVPNLKSDNGTQTIDGMYDPTSKSIYINSTIENENAAMVHELGHAADYATSSNPNKELDAAESIFDEAYGGDTYYERASTSYDKSSPLDSYDAIQRGENINRINMDPWDKNITKSAKKYAEKADLQWDYAPYRAAVDRIKKSIGFTDKMTEREFSLAGGDELPESDDLNLIMSQSYPRPSYMNNSNPIYNILKNSQYTADPADMYSKFGDKTDFRYFTSPTEVSSRLMEMRYDMGVKPDEKITKEKFESFIKQNKDRDYYKDLLKVSNNGDDSIIDMLNNFVSSDKKTNNNKNSGYLDYLKTVKNA